MRPAALRAAKVRVCQWLCWAVPLAIATPFNPVTDASRRQGTLIQGSDTGSLYPEEPANHQDLNRGSSIVLSIVSGCQRGTLYYLPNKMQNCLSKTRFLVKELDEECKFERIIQLKIQLKLVSFWICRLRLFSELSANGISRILRI